VDAAEIEINEKIETGKHPFFSSARMDYSEEAFQELLKMRALGKKHSASKNQMTDTMYEILGFKVKGECDKIFSEWTQRVCPEGYWMPGMKR
jgi:hypothetical protein